MKKALFITLLSLPLFLFSQTDFNKGYEKGYKEGYCYEDLGCLPPNVGLTPSPNYGYDSYKDGYNRGFSDGKAAKSGNSSSGSSSGRRQGISNNLNYEAIGAASSSGNQPVIISDKAAQQFGNAIEKALINTKKIKPKIKLIQAQKLFKASKISKASSLLKTNQSLIEGSNDVEIKNQYYLLKGQIARLEEDYQVSYDNLLLVHTSASLKDFAAIELKLLTSDIVNTAIKQSEQEEFILSAKNLFLAYTIDKKANIDYLYYAATTAVKAKNYPLTLEYYLMLKEMSYNNEGLENLLRQMENL